MTDRVRALAIAAIVIGASPLAAPRLLAFPYSTIVGQHHVYSETPIDPGLASLVSNADRKLAGSPLAPSRASDQSIFLTRGGWRWRWLALNSAGAFALTRPLSEAVIVNRSDMARNDVSNGAPVAGNRSLDGTIVHEMTHGLIRSHFGILADARYPAELR